MKRALRARRTKPSGSLFVRAREEPLLFDDVYVAYSDHILRYFAQRTFDPNVAFDLMAETFAELFARLPKFRGQTEDEGRAWMWSIAKAQLALWHRKGAVERRNLERLAMSTPSIAPDEYERIERLADLDRIRPHLLAALRELMPDQREVLQHRIVEERDYEQMADEAGISQVAMRMRVSRAVAQLSSVLARDNVIDREGLQELSG